MKHFQYISIMIIIVSWFAINSYSIEVGDSREKVISELGDPEGVIKSTDYEMLSYERGKIQLMGGVVTSANIMTAEELISTKENARIIAEKKEEEQEAFIKLNHQRGLDLRERIVTSTVFPEFPGNRKVQILKNFSKNYPEIDITDLLLPALEEMEQEVAETEQQNKIVELEQRVDEAKLEALRARWRESAAREDNQDYLRSQFYLQQSYLRCHPYYRMQTGGFSAGYDTPGIRVNRSGGYGGGWHAIGSGSCGSSANYNGGSFSSF